MDKESVKSRVLWALPVGTAAGLLALSLALIVYTPYAEFLLVPVVIPLVCLSLLVLLLIASLRKRRRLQGATAIALVASIAISLAVLKLQVPIRESLRWLFWSNRFKAELMAIPSSSAGELKHMEWEATGFAGVADNTSYLVFDPADSLNTAARSGSSGRYSGLPCEVVRVRRLEAHWYSVWFYTDEAWGEKNGQDCSERAL